MKIPSISQLRYVVLRSKTTADGDWSVPMVLGPDDLGQDDILTMNISPRVKDRSTSAGTSHVPIKGTYDDFSASLTFLPETWSHLGKAINKWTQATYEGATTHNGQMIGSVSDLCDDGGYLSVVLIGICDDGSSADVEFPRCMPTIDGELSIGTTDTTDVTLALNPQIYNPNLYSTDGYPQYDYRVGDESLTIKQRLNIATGAYEAVTAEDTTTDGGE